MPVNEPSPLHAARFRIAVAACLSACVMASLYYGSTALVSLVVAGWILHVTPGGHVLSVRRITQVYLAIIVSCAINPTDGRL
jgi:branched-subunit amino acid transport protein AzlD